MGDALRSDRFCTVASQHDHLGPMVMFCQFMQEGQSFAAVMLGWRQPEIQHDNPDVIVADQHGQTIVPVGRFIDVVSHCLDDPSKRLSDRCLILDHQRAQQMSSGSAGGEGHGRVV